MKLIIFALIPLILSIGIIPVLLFDDAFALKGKGKSLREIGSNKVCGDRLCSEITKDEKTFESTSKNLDPLSSWNEGKSKEKIIEFVNQVTDSSSPSFVPITDRIATFDNDGTLWIEQPLYIPLAFHLEYLYQQIENDPNLASTSPYSELLSKKGSIINEDLEHIPELFEVLMIAYPNITQQEYIKKAKDFLDNTIHPRFNVAVKEMTYQPMVELVQYLKQNDFDVYIVSGGFQGMMRAVSEEIYNIEKENVIGTHPEFIYQLTEQGPILIRQPVLDSFNDEAEKPVNILKRIGKMPVFACGNSGGDIEMLTLTQNHKNHFACMVDHDDENREYFYPNSEALSESQRNGWTVISMKNDFKTVFSNHPKEIEYECSSDFWKNNLELWENVGVNYNDDFDETFGKNYFDPDITLEQAIDMEGVGMNHLARSGTTAYLNALVDPEIDEETVRTAVYFGYVHQIDNYIKNCKNVENPISLK